MTLYFESEDGTRFWEISVDGAVIRRRYGKTGRDGRGTSRTYNTPDAANATLHMEVGKKFRSGYRRTVPPREFPSPGSNEELESAIAASPEVLEPYLVLADWLQSAGDPRGELIAVQYALREEPDDRELRETERRILRDQPWGLFGKLAAYVADPNTGRRRDGLPGLFICEWELGFVRSLYVGRSRHPPYESPQDPFYGLDEDVTIDPAALTLAFLDLPCARLLRSLTFDLGLWPQPVNGPGLRGWQTYEGVTPFYRRFVDGFVKRGDVDKLPKVVIPDPRAPQFPELGIGVPRPARPR